MSVVIPVYNRSAASSLCSVAAQTYRPLEVIVVDDGSTDPLTETGDGCPGVTLLRQPHTGAPAARNLGTLASKGEYIQYLDSDDLLEAGKSARQVALFREHPQTDISYSDSIGFIEPGPDHIRYRLCHAPRDPLRHLLHHPRILCHTSSLLWRRSAVARIGPWDTRLLRGQDWDYLVRALVCDLVVEHVSEIGARWSLTPGSITRSPLSEEKCKSSIYLLRKTLQLLRDNGKATRRNLTGLCLRCIDDIASWSVSGLPHCAAQMLDVVREIVRADTRASAAELWLRVGSLVLARPTAARLWSLSWRLGSGSGRLRDSLSPRRRTCP